MVCLSCVCPCDGLALEEAEQLEDLSEAHLAIPLGRLWRSFSRAPGHLMVFCRSLEAQAKAQRAGASSGRAASSGWRFQGHLVGAAMWQRPVTSLVLRLPGDDPLPNFLEREGVSG